MGDNRGPETVAVAAVVTAVAIVTLALRFYVRCHLVKTFGWEDGFMLVAFVGQAMFAIGTFGAVHNGAGRHMKDLSYSEATAALKWIWAIQIGYGIGVIFVRISIGLMLLRFIISKVQKWIIYITLAITGVVSFIVFLIGLFECKPLHIFWDPARTASCNASKIAVITGIIGSLIAILCDFTLAIVPMVLVWGLSLSRSTKLALIPIFGLGTCASIGAVLEIVYLSILKADDFTYGILFVVLWSNVELGLAIMAGNLVTIRPLYRKVVVKLGLGSGASNFFKFRTPRWTGFFSATTRTRDEHQQQQQQQSQNSAHRSTNNPNKKRHSHTQQSGESYTLVGSNHSRIRDTPTKHPVLLEHIGRLPNPDPERQENRVASPDDIQRAFGR